ncbi:MAG: nuclear transport factor 2 family protein [Pseudonocardiaceae bacterium]
MSRQNVELVRHSMEAFARGDFATAFSAYDSGIEWSTAVDEPDAHTYRGTSELRRFVASLGDLWADRFDGSMVFEELIGQGAWVVAPWAARLRGRASGIEVEVTETYAVLVRNGRIARVEEHRTTQQALDAVARRQG